MHKVVDRTLVFQKGLLKRIVRSKNHWFNHELKVIKDKLVEIRDNLSSSSSSI